jgi:hypothetical protein
MIKSTTRVGRPARVFRYGDENEKKMQVQFARIAVLYHDRMREFAGANEEGPIPALDGSGFNGRRFYFRAPDPRHAGGAARRRCRAGHEQGVPEAQGGLAGGRAAAVGGGAGFFAANHEFLKDWRKDVGGHFHDKAAEFAIDNIEDETVGSIEIYGRGTGADVRMKDVPVVRGVNGYVSLSRAMPRVARYPTRDVRPAVYRRAARAHRPRG